MKNFHHHERRSIRLRDFDYSQIGAYFVTICTYKKANWFGEIEDGEVRLNKFGLIINAEWLKTTEIRTGINIDSFIVMPNHLHGIIVIAEQSGATRRVAPTSLRSGSLGSIIGQFKSKATKTIRRNGLGDFRWQRNYYEHIIRNDSDMNGVRQYIASNASNWDTDEENPRMIKKAFGRGDPPGRPW
jgi:putative transposase